MSTKRTPGLAVEFTVTATILLLVANIFLGTILIDNSKEAMKTLINSRMLDVSNVAADMLDGDTLEKLRAEDMDSPGYRKINDTLAVFQKNIDLKYIYCIKDNGGGNFSFSVDPSPVDPGEFGEPIVYTDALFTASQGTPAVDDEPYTDSWGRFYSAYSPVFNSTGKVAGIVAVDFSADWYDAQIAKQTRSILLTSIVEVLLGVMLAILATWRLRKKLSGMTEELGELAKTVDELTLELNPDKTQTSFTGKASDGIQELGNRIHSIKEELKLYTSKLRSQANSMITALSSNYHGIYHIDLDTMEGICYRSYVLLDKGLQQGEHFPYSEAMAAYAEKYVTEKYREAFLRFMTPETIRESIKRDKLASFLYTTIDQDGLESYEMLRMAEISHGSGPAHEVGIGFEDVDAETRSTLMQDKALRDALSTAEGANKAKTVFLSNMSHEIRTPMNAIIGLNRIALNDPDLSSSTRDYLQKIGTSADHLLSIINEILDMTRIESGKMVLRQESFSLPKLLEQINVMIGGQCEDKGLVWNWRLIGEADEYYVGDDMKLKEILINILGNAVKFTPEGGEVTFTVEGTRHYEGKTVFCFTIKDTGIGMSRDYLPKLFDPFSLEDYSTKTKYGSTGLGMSITKSIVEMMNGDIKVDSEKNAGTTFTVTLTLNDYEKEEATEEAVQADGTSSAKAGYADLRGCRVLVAEDVEINADIIRMVLDVRGVETDIAQNGRIAVEKFSSFPAGHYDAILMDMRMPEMDGLEATQAIRGMSRQDAKSIPIIALTANAFDEDVQRSLQSGLNAHLSKPVEPEKLFETLETLIQQ